MNNLFPFPYHSHMHPRLFRFVTPSAWSLIVLSTCLSQIFLQPLFLIIGVGMVGVAAYVGRLE